MNVNVIENNIKENLNDLLKATELLDLLSDGFTKGLGDRRHDGWEKRGGATRSTKKKEKYGMNPTFLL